MKPRFLIIGLSILLITGCATRMPKELSLRPDAPTAAKYFYTQLDTHTKKEGIASSLGSKIEGFPYLRTNRFFTHLKTRLHTQRQKKDWINHLVQYDLNARTADIRALSDEGLDRLQTALGLPENTSREGLIQLLGKSSQQLLNHDQKQDLFYETVIQKTESPDDYSTPLRIMGLYPLAYGPVIYFTKKSYEEMNIRHQTHPDQLPVLGEQIAYLPKVSKGIQLSDIQDLFSGTPTDSLGIRQFSNTDLHLLLQYYAPGFLIDIADNNDRPGRPVLQGHSLHIETAEPVIYYYFSHALMRNSPVFQINYVIWFPARKGPVVPWYEQGKMDGFTFRVTLDQEGVPVVLDNVHNCGCYHFFAPDQSRIDSLKPMATEFGNQVPAWMPEDFPENRLLLYVSSGWHQVDHIGTLKDRSDVQPYELIPYSEIESLNIFNTKGVIKGTSRIEPLFLFPMGIPDIGAMRQRTRQPTRLLGKEHFDNPRLLDNYFDFK